MTSLPSRLQRKTNLLLNSRHAGVRDKNFCGNLHKMSNVHIMLLICVELDRIQLLDRYPMF